MEASAAKALAKDGVSTPAGGVGDGVTLLVVDSLVGSLTLLLVHGVTLVVIDRVVDRLTLEI